MSNPVSFVGSYVSTIQSLISNLQALRTMNDQIAQDSTLVTRYFSTPSISVGQGQTIPRTDIAAADVTNARDAIVQLLFTFDSGSPTQKSYLYKVLP
jgi:hypothetical protein